MFTVTLESALLVVRLDRNSQVGATNSYPAGPIFLELVGWHGDDMCRRV
jgi:hypothetical protein